jgi:hypothetical protein
MTSMESSIVGKIMWGVAVGFEWAGKKEGRF